MNKDNWFFTVETKPGNISHIDNQIHAIFSSSNYLNKLPNAFLNKVTSLSPLYKEELTKDKLKELYKNELTESSLFNPLTNEIACVAIIYKDQWILLKGTEQEILKEFWSLVSLSNKTKQKWIGWNCKNFSIPLILKKSWKHGIKVPSGFNPTFSRYYNDFCIDLMSVFSGHIYSDFASLDVAYKTLDIDPQFSTKITGESLHVFLSSEEHLPQATTYLQEKVNLLRTIFSKINLD